MKSLGKHFEAIRKQREILCSYEQWEIEFDLMQRAVISRAVRLQDAAAADKVNVRVRVPELFAEQYAGYHHNLDVAEKLLKVAASIGTALDISDRPVAHDVRLVSDPIKLRAHLGDKQRARDNLVAVDFYDTCGHMPGVHVSKITIPHWKPITADATSKSVAREFENPEFIPYVIASFETASDATLYKLSA